MIVCATCGRESPDDVRFCAGCGAALTAHAAQREERKVVSVVFVDLVGHTARSDSSDPEDVRATLAPYHARAREVLERFGGTVEKFIGDAVMAVFGAPTAHDDDTERAVRAALAVRDALVEDGLEVRVAVNTGEALVSLDADAGEGEALVAGDVVNTAARLQAAAPVNGVIVGAVTHRATDRVIQYTEASAVTAKGKAAPVAAWEAVAPIARLGVDVAHHGAAELVGRDLELRVLRDALERARGQRSMQLVTLVGVPGMGKSRLVWELFRLIEGELEFTYWRQGRALAYGGGAFGAIAEVVRAQIGMLESDSPDEAAEKLKASVDDLPLDGDERDWLQARLGPLIGLDAREPGSREESFVAWRRLFEAVAEVRPLVLVLEDLHWADDGTLDFVEHLADWADDSPLLVLCTARSELLDRRPAWGGGRVNSNTVALSPLSDESTALLLGRLLERPALDADVQSRLLQQAGGNPLYAEEYARMLTQGNESVALPDTVQGVIAARLDRLDPPEKALLQAAAVLGKVFWRGGLVALGADTSVDDSLQRLVRKEFIRRERSSSMTGEPEFAFRHALVRDVAYSQLPRVARAEMHCLAAEWIAATAVGRPDLVAHHYAEALALVQAAGGELGPIEERARHAFRAAAGHAWSLGAADDAAVLYRRALDLWPDDDERPALWLALAEAEQDLTPVEALASAERARDGFASTGNAGGVAHAETVLALASWQIADVAGSRLHAVRAVAAANASGSVAALARATTQQARLLSVSGDSEGGMAAGLEAIPLAESAGLERTAIAARISVGSVRGDLLLDGWEEELIDAAARARAVGDVAAVFRALNNRAHCVRRIRGVAESVSIYDDLAVYIGRFPWPYELRWIASIQGWVRYQCGFWDEALGLVEQFFAAAPGVPHYQESQSYDTRASIEFARGDAAASVSGAAALEPARQIGDLQALAPALASAAQRALEDGRHREAQALAEELLGLSADGPSTAVDRDTWVGWLAADLEPRLGEGWGGGTVWRDANRAIIDGRLEEAISILERTGAATSAAYARLRLAERLLVAGADPEPWLSEAEAFYRGVRATRYLQQLEQVRATRRSA